MEIYRICLTRRVAGCAIVMLVAVAATWLMPGTAVAAGPGNLFAWGDGGIGQLCDGSLSNQDQPDLVTLAPGVLAGAVTGGDDDTLAIGSDGKLYGCGYNGDGELGDATASGPYYVSQPRPIGLPPGVAPEAIAEGYEDSLMIGSDGNLYTWGDNAYGELGNGTTTEQNSPDVISLGPGVSPTAIAAYGYDSYAIGSDGRLYAWGWNAFGQLGDGTTSQQVSPEAITLAAGVSPKAIAPGDGYAFAIGSDGQLYGWGNNSVGYLGDGTNTQRDSPEVITLAPDVSVSAVAAGYAATLAIGSDGQLWPAPCSTCRTQPEPAPLAHCRPPRTAFGPRRPGRRPGRAPPPAWPPPSPEPRPAPRYGPPTPPGLWLGRRSTTSTAEPEAFWLCGGASADSATAGRSGCGRSRPRLLDDDPVAAPTHGDRKRLVGHRRTRKRLASRGPCSHLGNQLDESRTDSVKHCAEKETLTCQ